MRWPVPFLLSTIVFAGISEPAADPASAEPVTELPEFVVRAMRQDTSIDSIPAAISLVTAESIQRATQQLTLDEALRGVPGVFVLNPVNFAQDTRIAIRGFGARADFGIRGIQLIVDGIPATMPDGQGGVDGIDFGSAARMEIIRGPASALYGASSGGVIRIETEDGPAVPFLESRLIAGDDGFFKGQVKYGGQEGPLNYLLHGSRLEYDGYRDHSGTRNWKFNSKLRYDFDASSRLTAIVNLIDIPLQDDPGGLTMAEALDNPRQARDRNLLYNSGEEVRQQKIGLLYRKDWNHGQGLELNGYHVHRDFSNRLPFENGGQVSFSRDFSGGGIRYGFSSDRATLSAGVDAGLQDDARKNYDNLYGERGPLVLDQRERVFGLGVYGRLEYQLLPDLAISAALRHDRVEFRVDDHFVSDGNDSGDIDFSNTSPMAGVVWHVRPGLHLFANISTSFETPTTTEFDNPEGGGFNEILKPQTATNVEVGMRGYTEFLSRSVRFDLAFFHIDIEDALVPYELSEFPDREFFRNAGSSLHRGFEAAVSIDLLSGLSASLSYTWSDFAYKSFEAPSGDFAGNRIPGIPEHFADAMIRYDHASGFYLQWDTRWVGDLYADDANSTTVDGSIVTDLRMGIDLEAGAWTIAPFIGFNNLFGEAYYANIRINAFGGRYYEPGPGRIIYGGLRVRYSFR